MITRGIAVSDKVVLSDKVPCPSKLPLKPRLRRGQVYCVREVIPTSNGSQAVRLVGVQGPVNEDGYEVAVICHQFRVVHQAGGARKEDR